MNEKGKVTVTNNFLESLLPVQYIIPAHVFSDPKDPWIDWFSCWQYGCKLERDYIV
jgi:hypothetical protein